MNNKRGFLRFSFIFLIAVLLLLVNSCSGIRRIEKRHYRPGFYLQKKHPHSVRFSDRMEKSRLKFSSERFPDTIKRDTVKPPDKIQAPASPVFKAVKINKSVEPVFRPDKKPVNELSKEKKKRSSKTSFWIAGVFFFLALLTVILLLLLFTAGSLPLGGFFALLLGIPLIILYLVIGIIALLQGIRTKKTGEPEPDSPAETKTEKPVQSPVQRIQSLNDTGLVSLLLGIILPFMPIVTIITSIMALRLIKKNSIDNQKQKRRARLLLLLAILYYPLGFILFLLTAEPA